VFKRISNVSVLLPSRRDGDRVGRLDCLCQHLMEPACVIYAPLSSGVVILGCRPGLLSHLRAPVHRHRLSRTDGMKSLSSHHLPHVLCLLVYLGGAPVPSPSRFLTPAMEEPTRYKSREVRSGLSSRAPLRERDNRNLMAIHIGV